MYTVNFKSKYSLLSYNSFTIDLVITHSSTLKIYHPHLLIRILPFHLLLLLSFFLLVHPLLPLYLHTILCVSAFVYHFLPPFFPSSSVLSYALSPHLFPSHNHPSLTPPSSAYLNEILVTVCYFLSFSPPIMPPSYFPLHPQPNPLIPRSYLHIWTSFPTYYPHSFLCYSNNHLVLFLSSYLLN